MNKTKYIKNIIKISAVITILIGEVPAFAQNEIEVDFYAGRFYQITSSTVGNCSGEVAGEKTCRFPLSQINNVRVKLNVNVSGTAYNCFFTGGTTKQGEPYFTGNCPSQVGTVYISNTPMVQPNQPIIVNLP